MFTEERLNNQRQLRLDDEKVAGHGCRAKGVIGEESRLQTPRPHANVAKTRRWIHTSNVVDCDDAGGQHLSWGAESPVPQLLVSSDACNTEDL